jgi:hypothetical protein
MNFNVFAVLFEPAHNDDDDGRAGLGRTKASDLLLASKTRTKIDARGGDISVRRKMFFLFLLK